MDWTILKLNGSNTSTGIAVATAVVVTTLFAIFHRAVKKKEDHHDDCCKSKRKPTESWESHVDNKHGPLREIWPDTLYMLEAPGCSMGPPIRNMTIYRVPDASRRLVIFNGIAVSPATLAQIEALGTPSILVVPNSVHRCCAAVWKEKFPQLQVVCPAVAVSKVSDVVHVDATTLEWEAQPEWNKWIHCKEIDGWCDFETVLEVSLVDTSENGKRAMLVCDLLFTIPYTSNPSFTEQLIVWFFDSSIDLPAEASNNNSNNINKNENMIIPKVSRIGRLFGIKDWPKVERWYRSYARECGPSIAVIAVGHGVPIVEIHPADGCTQALEGVADQVVTKRW